MPNQYSKDSRRVSYVEDRSMYEHLEEVSKKEGVTVGELIRRAVDTTYGFAKKPTYGLKKDKGGLDQFLTRPEVKMNAHMQADDRSGITYTVMCDEVEIGRAPGALIVRMKEVAEPGYYKQEHPYFDAGAEPDAKAS